MSKTIQRWMAALLLSVGLLSARTRWYEQPSLSNPFLLSTLVQTSRDLEDLQRYYQEAQEQIPGVSPAEQRVLQLEQWAYLEKMRRLAAAWPLAVSREMDAFLLAHEADPDPLVVGR